MNELSEKRVARMLRKAGGRILENKDFEPLIGRVLADAADAFFTADSPLGEVYVAVSRGGVRCLSRADSEKEFVRFYGERFERLVVPAEEGHIGALAEKVRAALAGRRVDVPLDLGQTTPFQRRVMEIVKDIPRGEVRPYSWVAHEAGAPRASRAVGSVMANNPIPLIVPCHRVVRNDGSPGNYGFGPGKKVELLKREGVPVGEISRAPYVATPTTGVVCHATCRNARRIRPDNRLPFRSVAEAMTAGFSPCKVCRPVAAA